MAPPRSRKSLTSSIVEEEPPSWTTRRSSESWTEAKIGKLKDDVRLRDKQLRSKGEDPLRTETYKELLRYFSRNPLSKLKRFIRDLPEDFLEEFCAAQPGFKTCPQLERRMKMQELVDVLDTKYSLSWKYSFCTALKLRDFAHNKESLEWATLLLEGSTGPQNCENSRELLEKVKEDMAPKIMELNEKTGRLVTLYDHCYYMPGFGYVCLRSQPKDATENKASYFVFAFAVNFPYVFCHAERRVESSIMKIITSALKFRSWKHHDLKDVGLTAMFESCNRKVIVPSATEFKRKFEEEQEANKRRHLVSGCSEHDRIISFGCALLDDKQLSGVKTCTLDYIVPTKPGSPQGKPAITLKINLKNSALSMDEYIAGLYREGLIRNIAPFLQMKNTQTNHVNVLYSDPN